MKLPEANHPLWPILRSAVVFAGAILILERTATNFDLGEMKAAGGVAIITAVFDIVKRSFSSNT